MTALQIGATIGILGGGQLGRMLSQAAARLGFDVHIYCPEADCPAARVSARHMAADYDDAGALARFAEACDVITYEFENVPVATIEVLQAQGALVRPGATSLNVSQDRVDEKSFLNACGIETAKFAAIGETGDIAPALDTLGGAGILKTRRDGYDGKGQVRVVTGDDFKAAHRALANAPTILEQLVAFEREISVVVARDAGGETLCFDIPKNTHVNGILRRSEVPSGVSGEVEARACAAGVTLIDALDHVGVLALEFFVLADGQLLANEFAPRVHNSGHWTPEACQSCQFEQHIRAIAGWPLAPVTRFFDVEMINLLGEEALPPALDLSGRDQLTLYGKRSALPGRKMGHVVRRLGPAQDGAE
ncbi:MAG: 5-(carboxyamino)imidazole ribonucleotide synthase [Pseudomonadota bacterium]